MAYYAPQTGGLPTLSGNSSAGYQHTRRLPAPYSYGDDFRGGNQTGIVNAVPKAPSGYAAPQPGASPYPAPVTPPLTQPQQQTVPTGLNIPGEYSGGVYTPKFTPWVTDKGFARPITFPGIKHRGRGNAVYEDDSWIDYASDAWGKAQRYVPPADYADLWTALPDSWKADLAGRDPSFVQAYLQAVGLQNNDQAQQIYDQSGQYRDAQQQAASAKAQNPQTGYRDAAFYVPSR